MVRSVLNLTAMPFFIVVAGGLTNTSRVVSYVGGRYERVRGVCRLARCRFPDVIQRLRFALPRVFFHVDNHALVVSHNHLAVEQTTVLRQVLICHTPPEGVALPE